MIANPPHIVLLLRSWNIGLAMCLSPEETTAYLARLLQRTIGRPPYEAFLKTYQLYLQSIPLETAKAAWGLNAARQHAHP